MKFPVFVALLVLQGCSGQDSGFNRVLQFPRQVSTSNYVLLKPDFAEVREAMSICAWVKFYRTDGHRYFFSYATGNSNNEILLGDQINTAHLFSAHFPGKDSDSQLPAYIWYHVCFTWSAASQLKQLYYNGELVAQEVAAAGRKLTMNGTLVLGQDQDSVGGSFAVGQAFGGELYRLQIFKKKISAEDIAEMYRAGICDYPSHSEDIAMDWEDFLEAQRNGEVAETSAGCSKWNILKDFMGQEITHDLVSYLKRHHEF